MRRATAIAATLAALALPTSASAAFGDNFGFVPINSHPEAIDQVPALPGYEHALWAGTCERAAMPAPGTPLDGGDPAGFGVAPATVFAPTRSLTPEIKPPFHAEIAAPEVPAHCIDWGAPFPVANGLESWVSAPHGRAPSWRAPAIAQAGSHPDGTTTMALRRIPVGEPNTGQSDGFVDNIIAELPPGFVGDPRAVAQCTQEQFALKPTQCPPASQVGVLNLHMMAAVFGENFGSNGWDAIYPVWNLEPRTGRVAELGFAYASGQKAVTVRLSARVRSGGDFGVTAFVGQIPAPLPLSSQAITLWGVPWAAENDAWRAQGDLQPNNGPCNVVPETGTTEHYLPPDGLPPVCQATYEPAWGPIRPFISNETDCNPAPVVEVFTDAYIHPGSFDANGDPDRSDPDWERASSPSPAVTGCEKLGFEPAISLDPKLAGGAASEAADSPAGLDVELRIPQNGELPFDAPPDGAPQVEVDQYRADAISYWRSEQGLVSAHLRDTVVTLPEGMTLNPAAADGQGACSMAQMGVTDTASTVAPRIRFDTAPVSCPESSKVGEVVVETPVLEEADWPSGSVYLAEQGKNPFGSDFAIYIALSSPQRGFTAKLAGKVTPDPITGRLTTTFADNPELPFGRFTLRFERGPRAPLAMPTTCGTHTSSNSFASHAQPDNPVAVPDSFQVGSSPAGGCAATKESRPFALGFSAGSTELVAGAHSPFTARFTRGDGNQELDRIELTTPEGLAAKLAGVPYCPEAGIAQATARTASGDGAIERVAPSCPAASQVGTTTIGAGAGSQPFFVEGNVYLAGPYKGAPVSLAFVVPAVAGPFDLGVQVVRTALNVDPKTAQVTAVSDTIPKILRGIPLRIREVRVDIDRGGFIVNPTDCSEQLVRGKVFGASGAVTDVSNRFQIAECARLGFKPKLSLRLFGKTERGAYQRLRAVLTARPGDANIARAAVTLPHSAFLAQEHIQTICTRVQFAADACPARSVYGSATAISPLLDAPLSGPVYLRSSSNPLPDLVAALRGPDHQPIEIELAGRTDSKNEGIRNTFDLVPDAPVSKFVLELKGGKKSLIVNSTNICRGVHKATVRMAGQNGRSHHFATKVVNPKCGKAKKGKRGGGPRGAAR